MRKENTAVVPKANTSKYGLKSFVHDGPRIWNSLPHEMRKTVNYGEFWQTDPELGWPIMQLLYMQVNS